MLLDSTDALAVAVFVAVRLAAARVAAAVALVGRHSPRPQTVGSLEASGPFLFAPLRLQVVMDLRDQPSSSDQVRDASSTSPGANQCPQRASDRHIKCMEPDLWMAEIVEMHLEKSIKEGVDSCC